ncbi:hypothetical protein RHMOL_Rhmol04G0221400 [Rhododendron molle]|uniref:Uncharacterized protein n=1 Tax=Rhododendron molle TaxID=49168 RepID=A0ACC0P478_RHOML|nr:hypothetical protein RHMOL_Rhmol04G0221400 [Rhododendron molle]
MTARDRFVFENYLQHSAVDFAEVDSVGTVTMLGTGDGGLEREVCGREEEELPKMCYANSVCKGVLYAIYRCCFCMREVSTYNRSSSDRLLLLELTPILDLSEDYFKA